MALIPALTMASVLLFQAAKGLTIGILFHAQSVIVEVPQPSPNSRKGVVEMAMAFALTFFRKGWATFTPPLWEAEELGRGHT